MVYLQCCHTVYDPVHQYIYIYACESVTNEWMYMGVFGRHTLRLHGASGSRSGLGRWYFAPHRFSGHWRFMRLSEHTLTWVLLHVSNKEVMFLTLDQVTSVSFTMN